MATKTQYRMFPGKNTSIDGLSRVKLYLRQRPCYFLKQGRLPALPSTDKIVI